MICVWSGVPFSERRRSRLDRSLRGPDRPYSLSPINQRFNGYRKSGIKRPSNKKTRLKAKLRAKSLSVDAVACRTRFFRPWSYFSWSWRPFSPICARLRTIWAKPPELGDYSGRMRGLIARRFWTVEFERVSVRNFPFDFCFAESPFRFSKLSRLNSPRVVVYISAGNVFQRNFCVGLP